LCCKLIPVEELAKPAGTRCVHQRTGKGCAIYAKRPTSCRAWNCLWLIGTEGGHELPLSRPDRSHYVLDEVPDLVRARDDKGEIVAEITCMQVWVDPLYPDAWQDPALLDMLERQNVVALVRYSSSDAFAISPPGQSGTGKWERSRRHETSASRDLEEARLKARFQFWAKQAKEQALGNDTEAETG
jgi:hypothetical protein